MGAGLLFPLVLALLLAFFILYRSSIHRIVRISMVMIIIGLLVFWWPEVYTEAITISTGKWKPVLFSTIVSAANALPWIWPIALIIIFYSANDHDARIFLLILITFSLLVIFSYVAITFTSTFSNALPAMQSM